MSYDALRKTAEYFEDRARRTRQLDKRERLAAVAKKYRLRAEAQRKLDIQSARNEGSKIERQAGGVVAGASSASWRLDKPAFPLRRTPPPRLSGAHWCDGAHGLFREVVLPRGNVRRDFIDRCASPPALCNRLWYFVCGLAGCRNSASPL